MRRLTEFELSEEGEALGRSLPPGAIVLLEGDLGAGKTTLARAIVRGLGAAVEATSPTYALVHRYPARRGPVFHLDCYRMQSPAEAADLDWAGLTTEGDVVLVEWPERAGAWVPPATLHLRLHHLPDDPDRRGIEVG